jgi:hypothetical protein
VCRDAGATCIEPSIRRAPPLIFCFRHCVTPMPRNGCFATLRRQIWRVPVSRMRRYQIRRLRAGGYRRYGSGPCNLEGNGLFVCSIGWSLFEPIQVVPAGNSMIVTGIFKNWSHDRDRGATSLCTSSPRTNSERHAQDLHSGLLIARTDDEGRRACVIELIHLICLPFLFLMRMGDEIPSTRPAEILSRFSLRAILSMSAVRNGSGAPEQ